ncbi:MAG: tetratricopeptide repeat protein [Candidatus Omnitrophota bacterium]
MRSPGKVINFVAICGIIILGGPDFAGASPDTSARGRDLSRKGCLVSRGTGASAYSKSLAHYTMGIIYDNENRPEDAIREYNEALRLGPDVSYIRTRLGVDYLLTKKEASAFEELTLAEKLDPQDAKPKFLTALIYTSLGKFEEARKKYEEVTRLDPESIWALSSLADVLVLEKKMAEAASIYEKLIEKEKNEPLLRFNLAVIYSRIGRLDPAVDKLKEAIRLKPDYIEAYIGLGVLCEMKKDYAGAARNFEKALAIEPLDARLHFYLGVLYEKKKEKRLAVKEFRETIKLDASFSDAYNYLGYMFAEDGLNLDEAEALIKKALRAEPDNGAYVDSLGWVYFKKGMYEKALVELERAVKLEPNEPEIKKHLDDVRKKLKK